MRAPPLALEMGPLPGDQGCGFIQEKEVSVLARTRDDAPGVQAADDPGFMLIKVNNLLIVVQDTAIAHESTRALVVMISP